MFSVSLHNSVQSRGLGAGLPDLNFHAQRTTPIPTTPSHPSPWPSEYVQSLFPCLRKLYKACFWVPRGSSARNGSRICSSRKLTSSLLLAQRRPQARLDKDWHAARPQRQHCCCPSVLQEAQRRRAPQSHRPFRASANRRLPALPQHPQEPGHHRRHREAVQRFQAPDIRCRQADQGD